ncbi:MAG: aminotransferase class I/II-fold pyridoxal phosphate-dependent enzyme [Pleomorphochaeta sp.]
MKINDFKLEVYFNKYEFSAPYLLTQSDCQSMTINELLSYEKGSRELFLESYLGYTEVSGSLELRKRISNLYSNIKDDNILIHTGAQEAIFNTMNILLEKDDHIITQFPTYQSLFEVANSIGCEISNWNIELKNNQWTMDIEKLENLIKENTKVIILNSPNNPTGYTFTNDELNKIVEISRKNNIYIFCDEVYKGLELDGEKRNWLADLYEKGISLGVMSKSYGLAGLRIGWIATQDKKILKKLTKMKHYTSICCSAPSEFLSTVALKYSDQILNKNLNLIQKNIDIAESFFSKYPTLFNFIKPMAGPVCFIKMNIDFSIQEFCSNLVSEKGVLLLPANIYSIDENYFRMGFGRDNFEKSLQKFEEYLIENKFV